MWAASCGCSESRKTYARRLVWAMGARSVSTPDEGRQQDGEGQGSGKGKGNGNGQGLWGRVRSRIRHRNPFPFPFTFPSPFPGPVVRVPRMPAIKSWARTDVGHKRKHNEDSFLVDGELGLFVVADGMGGHAAGEV